MCFSGTALAVRRPRRARMRLHEEAGHADADAGACQHRPPSPARRRWSRPAAGLLHAECVTSNTTGAPELRIWPGWSSGRPGCCSRSSRRARRPGSGPPTGRPRGRRPGLVDRRSSCPRREELALLMLTGLPVFRHRVDEVGLPAQEGRRLPSASTTLATSAICDWSCTSVMTGRPVWRRTSSRILRPAVDAHAPPGWCGGAGRPCRTSPCRWRDAQRVAGLLSWPATSRLSSRLSIEQVPAIRKRAAPGRPQIRRVA